MDFFSILSLLGGLAVFMLGMKTMGEGLERFSGGRLKTILSGLTSSTLRGVALGAAVTAIIQSSSAATVMTVGFVNSGVMQLSQAVGIIMGANVGTTATSWLLSLTGIGGESFFVRLLRPSSFAPVFACVGIVMTMFVKNEKKNNLGFVFLGFGILMLGMETMSSSVRPLAEAPEFQKILLMFSNPILGIVSGALTTAIIQSSSASVGILQALCTTGKINYSGAVPIIMGQNIGTCITTVLSAIGANKNAKRAAAIHLSFNLIGTAVFLILYYIFNGMTGLKLAEKPVNAAGIAMVHTVFNLFSTAVMLPFSKQLVRLAEIIIPETNEKEKYELFDERLLASPAVAVSRAKNAADNMGMYCVDSFELLIKQFGKYDKQVTETIFENEKCVDRYEDKIGTYLVKLSHENLTMYDSHMVSNMLHTIGDFERISDHIQNIAEAAGELNEKNIAFSKQSIHELSVLFKAVYEIIELSCGAFTHDSIDKAKETEPLEQLIDKLTIKIKRHHIKRLKEGECSIEAGFIFSDILTALERIADHCSNIAVCVIQVSDDSFDTHEYLNRVRYDGDNDFDKKYDMYKQKYTL